MSKKKRILTFEDLVRFCEENNFTNFSAKETGYQLAVQVPTVFEVQNESDDNHRGMMRLKFRLLHTGLNRNGSFISQDSAEIASSTISDRPILAAIHQLDDGSWDFETHNMEIIENEDGEREVNYIEKQVGSFSSEEPFWEHDDELDKDYLCAYGYIAEEYTRAADIIRDKGWTKNSCELTIEEFSYNAREKYLDLKSFYLSASTLLGARKDGKKIEEGMLGSRADIADFSKQNNSIFSREEIVELVKETIKQSFNINQNNENSEKGGKEQLKFKELLKKYNKTEKDIKFEYDGLSDEELEAKFAEYFDETEGEDSGESGGEGTGGSGGTETGGEESGENGESGTGESGESNGTEGSGEEGGESNGQESGGTENGSGEEVGGESSSDVGNDEGESSKKKKKKFQRVYELSHSDIRCGLYALLAPFEENDGDYYWITDVYDDHFVYEGWVNEGAIYDQKYSKDDDNLSFEGDRVHLNKEYLTDNELVALKEMRSNYAKFEEIQAKLEKYESEPKKMEILESSDWDNIRGTEAFANISKEENHFDLSADELSKALNEMLLEFSKGHKIEFSSKEDAKPTKTVGMKQLPVNKKRSGGKSRYGGIFSDKNED